MATRFTAPLPAPAGVSTRHPRTRRWWSTLAPEPVPSGATQVRGDWMTFTVQASDDSTSTPSIGGDVWTAQQFKGDVVVAVGDGRITVCTEVAGVENGRPRRTGLRRVVSGLTGSGGRRVMAGATVPFDALTRIEVDVEFRTRSSHPDEQAHIAAHGHGWPMSARLRFGFAVEAYLCEAVVDLHHPSLDDEEAIWVLCRELTVGIGRSVRPTDHPAEPPSHHRRTLKVRRDAPRPVELVG